jgi:hypothetical protein
MTDGESCLKALWRPKTRLLLLADSCGGFMWGPFLTRWRVCSKQLLLGLTSAVSLASEFGRNDNHVLLRQIREYTNLKSQVPVFIWPRNRVRLYPQLQGSLSFESYYSQGYGRDIRTSVHAMTKSFTKSKRSYAWPPPGLSLVEDEVTLRQSVSQYVLLTSPLWNFLSEGFCLKVAVLSLWGALSGERAFLKFAVQSLNVQKSCKTSNHTLLSHLRLPQPGGPGSSIYIPQEQGGPVIPPGTGFPLRRLLRLAGLRWRHSNPPPTWRARSLYVCILYIYIFLRNRMVKSKSRYDRQPVNQHTLGPSPRGMRAAPSEWISIRHQEVYIKAKFFVINGRAACEACSTKWNLGTNSAFALWPRKTKEKLNRVGLSQDLPDANWILASSPALKMRVLTLVPICTFFSLFPFFSPLETAISWSYKHFYLYIIWISTKPCITPAEKINTYMHKYAYKYTYICNCDSSIIGKFSSSLYLKKICCYKRFVVYPITKIMFHI